MLQGKYTLLLQAEGKQYIVTNLTTLSTILVNVVRIVLVIAGFNIVVIQAAYLTINLLRILYLMIYIKKHYKWINLNAEPDVKAISQKNSVLVMQITDMIFRNTDVLILTFFCDLKVVSVYTMYTMIYSMIKTGITPDVNALSSLMLIVTIIILTSSAIIQTRKIKAGANL